MGYVDFAPETGSPERLRPASRCLPCQMFQGCYCNGGDVARSQATEVAVQNIVVGPSALGKLSERKGSSNDRLHGDFGRLGSCDSASRVQQFQAYGGPLMPAQFVPKAPHGSAREREAAIDTNLRDMLCGIPKETGSPGASSRTWESATSMPCSHALADQVRNRQNGTNGAVSDAPPLHHEEVISA